ncbi:MAG: DUF1501 domain-containing protein [Gammaproteobacteria bacterium]
MNTKKTLSRRRFLERLAVTAVGSGAIATQGKLGLMQSALAATGDYSNLTDYKSLVCVFLFGGNDSFNTIVPTNDGPYAQYQNLRGAMALPQNSLLGLNGSNYGFHPTMGGLQNMYNTGKLAVVGNVGTLFEPTDRESYQNGTALLPPDLFSHNDQQEIWQTARAPLSGITQPGWGGRMADLLGEANSNPYVPPTITMAGNNNFQAGVNALPFSMNAFSGVEEFRFLSNSGWPPWEASRSETWSEILSAPYNHALERQAAEGLATAKLQIAELNDTLDQAPAIVTEYPEDSYIAAQLRMVARVISIREQLGMKRQIFFVGFGSFDFHGSQLNEQAAKLQELSGAMSAFQANMDELSLGDTVTAFTSSDFGRTLSVNGDGTDHGWGNAAMVMGGAVNGGAIYGSPPSLDIGGPQDTDNAGRMIPEYSLGQYGATLARWMGIEDSDLGDIFPYLNNFGSTDIGFMG